MTIGPIVPATLDGWSLLHQAFRLRWPALRALSPSARASLASEAARSLELPAGDGATGFVQLLGHKGDLLLIHARRDFDALAQAQLHVASSSLFEYLEPTFSYVSIVELGMYDMTGKLYGELAGRGLEAGTEAFEQAFAEEMATQAKRVGSRLFLELPHRRHVCFYPMNKRRGEIKNWYSAPFEDRAAMMREHGHIGRQYAGKVDADHLGLDRVRRLGMGRRPVRGRPGRLQAADLRDALRSRRARTTPSSATSRSACSSPGPS